MKSILLHAEGNMKGFYVSFAAVATFCTELVKYFANVTKSFFPQFSLS